MNESNDHGASSQSRDTDREPTLAEKARTLMQVGGSSSLATMSRKHRGFPFASVMPYAVDDQGQPVFLISRMAMHTKNILSEPRATLLVAEQSASPLGAARLSVMGNVTLLEEDVETAKAAQIYLKRHPDSQQWASFGDFDFYRMHVHDVYLVGGFGVMGWIKPEDYAGAAADPLVDTAQHIIQHMNEDHSDSMVLLARSQLGIEAEAAAMTAIDRYGFNVMLKTAEGVRGGRIAFPRQADSANETRKVLADMVKAARD